MDTARIRRTAAALNRAFLADLEALPAEAWSRPSDCAGWTVAHVVVHQAQVAELLADSLERGRAGDPGPPRKAAEGVQAWRAWRAGEQARRAGQPPAVLLREYRASVDALERALDATAGAEDVRAWHPVGPQTPAWLADQWLFELALHDWDIRVASDPAADLRPEALAAFARTLPARLGRGFSRADDPALAGRYRIELDSSESFGWSVRVGDGRVDSPSEDATPPDTTIRSDPAAFGLVMTNRRPVTDFEPSGRWRAEGDVARAGAFARAFASY